MSKFSVDKYQIHFSSVFAKDDIKAAFKKFLKSEVNIEPFDCIEDILKMKYLTVKEQNQIFLEILAKYLEPDAKELVNVSITDKEPLLKLKSDAKEGKLKNPYHDLAGLKKLLENELFFDNFPRFIRAKEQVSLFQKYKDDTSVMTPHLSVRFPYSDEHFNELLATETDFEFISELVNDSFEWEHVQGSKFLNVYFSQTDFLPKSTFFKGSSCIKIIGIIPASVNQVLGNFDLDKLAEAMSIKRTDVEKIYYSVDELKKMYPGSNIISSCVELNETVSLPFPINTPRRSNLCVTMTYDEKDDSYMLLLKPYLGRLDIKGKTIDWTQKNCLKNGFEGYYVPTLHFMKFKKLSDSTTHVTHLRSM